MNFVIAILLWFIFGLVHSLMARPFFKKLIKLVLGDVFEKYFYRFIYFILQCIFFYFIYGLIKNLDPGKIVFQLPEDYKIIYYILYVFSNLFLITSVLQFDVAEFVGFKQMIDYFRQSKNIDIEELNNTFLYRYIRHPMYLGIILVYIFSHTVFSQMFFINLTCIIFYVEIGSYFEEKTLIRKFGKKYDVYKTSTYKYLPFIR